MEIQFEKYQGAGNDFIMLNNLNGDYDNLTDAQIEQLCDRKFGIGADGLIKINAHEYFDYEVDYYNSDASKSFCGNGGRCAAAFARSINAPNQQHVFLGFDGPHQYSFQEDQVKISMRNVDEIVYNLNDMEIYTGSPHYIQLVDDLNTFPVFENGRALRYSEDYKKDGINVNFVQRLQSDSIRIRTYERGVEDETLACGTGVTAAAIFHSVREGLMGKQLIHAKAEGGDLYVEFNRVADQQFEEIFLIGPAELVFVGTTKL